MGSFKGKVICVGETPNTAEFYFIFEGELSKHSFVEVGSRLARVDELYTLNRFFQDPTEASAMSEDALFFPKHEMDINYAKASLVRAKTPPLPGEAVSLATESKIKELLGLGGALKVGKIETHDLEVALDLTKLFKKHLAILAMSGAGKSHFVSVLLEELSSLQNSPAVVVLDIHGEYARCFSDVARVVDAENDLTIAAKDLDVAIVKELFPHLTEAQEDILEKGFERFEKRPEFAERTVDALIEDISSSASRNQEATLNAILRKFRMLKKKGILSDYTTPNIADIEPSESWIIDFSGVSDATVLSFKSYTLLKKAFDLRKANEVPPLIVFVEEAHNLLPEKVQKRSAAGKELLERIAREGRKFGLSLALITQRPAHLSQTALSQCNTQVFFRITNPNDLDYIKRVSENMNDAVLRSLPSLNTGEAFITGEALKFPTFMKVRALNRTCEGREDSLEDMVEAFLKARETSRQDVASLMGE